MIDARNKAVHQGNFLADKSLFELGILRVGRDQGEDFGYVYDVPPRIFTVSSATLEQLNLHGTMVACYYNTFFTHDQARDDEFAAHEREFKRLRDECKTIQDIDTSPEIKATLASMRKIVEDRVHKERRRMLNQ